MRIGIITNKPYNQCETFIKAHIDLLPFDVVHYWLSNGVLSQGRKRSLFKKIYQKALKVFFSKDNTYFVAQQLIGDKVALVVAEYGMTGAEIMPSCKRARLPLIVHFHGHDAVRKPLLKKYGARYREMFDFAALIISVSTEMTKRLTAMGCSSDKIFYNVYGPNEDFFKVKPHFNNQQFIGIGRFVDKKAPYLTILAFKKVLEKYPQARLVLAGDGVLLDSCKDLVIALGLENHVELPGRINHSEYRAYLQESYAYVQHSLEAQDGDMEGTPVSILEASAAGLPVISTRHAGIPEVVIDGENGLLCYERDIQGMTNNMMMVLNNIDTAKAMGASGRATILNGYTMKHHIDKLSAILEKAAE
jgi:colanic acid/amylovoran biosynthesis glycosyltransferase